MQRKLLLTLLVAISLSAFCDEGDSTPNDSLPPVTIGDSPKKSSVKTDIYHYISNGILVLNFKKEFSDVKVGILKNGELSFIDRLEKVLAGQSLSYLLDEEVSTIVVYSGNTIIYQIYNY